MGTNSKAITQIFVQRAGRLAMSAKGPALSPRTREGRGTRLFVGERMALLLDVDVIAELLQGDIEKAVGVEVAGRQTQCAARALQHGDG